MISSPHTVLSWWPSPTLAGKCAPSRWSWHGPAKHKQLPLDLALVSTTSHKLAVILAIAYFAAFVGILFWPFPVDRPVDSALMQVIMWLHNHGLPQWFIGYRKVEFAANILLFIPLGIIVALRLHSRLWWLAAVIGAAVSGAVELAQAIFLPQRVPAWSDIVANTSGALLGALFVLFVWSVRRHRALYTSRSKA